MSSSRTPGVVLREVGPLRTKASTTVPKLAPGEHDRRLEELYRRDGHEWVAVYGDREHSANLQFLCGFDPRFEEALLLLALTDAGFYWSETRVSTMRDAPARTSRSCSVSR